MKKIVSLFCVIFLLLSCATEGVRIEEVSQSVIEIRKAVIAVIGEPRAMSSNGRDFYSAFYDKKGLPIELNAKSRYSTKVVINGDRRPYDIFVQVIFEKKIGNTFEAISEDELQAESIADKIKKQLNEGRDNRNIIDDFRAF